MEKCTFTVTHHFEYLLPLHISRLSLACHKYTGVEINSSIRGKGGTTDPSTFTIRGGNILITVGLSLVIIFVAH